MSKRNDTYERIDKEYYPTCDPKAMAPNFLKHLVGKTVAEPCVGEGHLVNQLTSNGVFVGWQSDVRDTGRGAVVDGFEVTSDMLEEIDYIVTNPPFKKDLLLPLISHFSSLKPTWLLLPADLMHNGYMVEYMKKCERVVSIGRLYFFENTWQTKVPFDYDQLDKKWDKQVVFHTSMKGIKYYTGYITNDGKPCKTPYVRGTDNFGWYKFVDQEVETIFETRGD